MAEFLPRCHEFKNHRGWDQLTNVGQGVCPQRATRSLLDVVFFFLDHGSSLSCESGFFREWFILNSHFQVSGYLNESKNMLESEFGWIVADIHLSTWNWTQFMMSMTRKTNTPPSCPEASRHHQISLSAYPRWNMVHQEPMDNDSDIIINLYLLVGIMITDNDNLWIMIVISTNVGSSISMINP